jgi:hypothetical protein
MGRRSTPDDVLSLDEPDPGMWAIFEQSGTEQAHSQTLSALAPIVLDEHTPDIKNALRIHGLHWSAAG